MWLHNKCNILSCKVPNKAFALPLLAVRCVNIVMIVASIWTSEVCMGPVMPPMMEKGVHFYDTTFAIIFC